MECTAENPCGGQSCIIARRQNDDFVYEDVVFRERGLPVRATCDTPPTAEQARAMAEATSGVHSILVGTAPKEENEPEIGRPPRP